MRTSLKVAAFALLVASVAGSQAIQKWIRPDGSMHFGEHAPPGSKLVGETGSIGTSGGGDIGGASAAENAHAARRAVERQGGSYSSTSWHDGAVGYAEAVRRQRSTGAPMMVYFRTDWCPYCQRFDGLLEEEPVRAGLASTIKVRINPELGAPEAALFKSEFKGRAYPSVYMVDAGGAKTKISHSGPAERFLAQFRE